MKNSFMPHTTHGYETDDVEQKVGSFILMFPIVQRHISDLSPPTSVHKCSVAYTWSTQAFISHTHTHTKTRKDTQACSSD